MNRLLLCALTLVALAAIQFPAMAADEEAKPAEFDPAALFDRLDANKDGQVTADEAPEDQKRLFNRLQRTADKDGNGQLSRDEFVAGLADTRPDRAAEAAPGGGYDPGAMFDRIDANGDGKLVPDEIPEGRREQFRANLAKADKDQDGALTKEEFAAGFRGAGGQGGRPMPGTDRLLKALDSNQDGSLSADELAAAGASLKKLDKDGDGALSRRELQAQDEQRPGQGGGPQRGAEAMQRRLKEADKDGDGKLSKEEAPDRLKQNFEKIDANGDGFLDEGEMKQMFAAAAQQFGPEAMLKRLKQADKDGDGKLSKDEAPDRLKQNFAKIDANGDGFLDEGEMKQMFAAAGQQFGPEAMLRRLKEADKDGDGRISKEEAPERMKQNFEKLDANGDGFIDQADMKARQKGGEPRKEPSPDKATKNKKKQAGKGLAQQRKKADKAANAKKKNAGKGLAQQRKKPAKNANAKKDGQGMARRLQKADKDSDGKISKNEAPEKLKLRFARLDTNSDGFIDRKEFNARDQQRKARMKSDRKKAEQKAA